MNAIAGSKARENDAVGDSNCGALWRTPLKTRNPL